MAQQRAKKEQEDAEDVDKEGKCHVNMCNNMCCFLTHIYIGVSLRTELEQVLHQDQQQQPLDAAYVTKLREGTLRDEGEQKYKLIYHAMLPI